MSWTIICGAIYRGLLTMSEYLGPVVITGLRSAVLPGMISNMQAYPHLAGRLAAAIRDIPRSCCCRWTYQTSPLRWVRYWAEQDCPAHRSEGK
jgi:hypothetical protein